jgi:hypothetical protein
MTEETSGMGPALAALTEAQRQFVIHYVETGGSDQLGSYLHAFPTAKSRRGASVSAHKMVRKPAIQAAVRELVGAVNLIELPKYVAAMRAIALNPEHRDQIRALVFFLGCCGIGPTFRHEHKVEVSETITFDRQAAIEELRQIEKDMRVNLLPAPVSGGLHE